MSECIEKVKARLKADSTVTLKEVEQMITDVMNQMDAGLPDDELLKNIKDITGARKEKLKRLALMNKLNNYRKRQSRIKHVQDLVAEDKDVKIPFTDIVLYNAEEHGFMQSVYNFENAVQASTGLEVANLEARIKKAGLMDYAKDKNNQGKFYEELEAQQVAIKDNRPTEPVTGDTAAFDLARIVVEKQDEMAVKLQAEGSTVGYLEKRITGQQWSMSKLATKYTKAQFADIAQKNGFTYNGIIPQKAEWERIYSEIVQNTFIDDENIFDVKKQFQNSRKIGLSKDAYLKFANEMMEGDSLFERVLLDTERQARQAAVLKHYGTDAKNQYKQILDQLIVGNKDSKSKLNSQFYKEVLPAFLFGETNRLGSPDAVKVRDAFKIIKGGSVISKLGLGFITSQADWVTTATRQQMLRGNKSNIMSEFMDAIGDLGKVLEDNKVVDGKKVVDDEILSFQVMTESVLNEMQGELSKFDSALDTRDSSGLMKQILKIQGKLIKLNGIEWFTRIKQQASYRGVSRILGEFSNRNFTELNSFLQKRLREADISESEWDFIRANAFADGRIMTANLNNLDTKAFKSLNPDAQSVFALTQAKSDLMTKLQVFMFKEAKSMTLEPSSSDRARLANVPILGGGVAQAGTFNRELSDLTMQFRSFSSALATRFLMPLIRDGEKSTWAQYIGATIAMNAAVIQIKDTLMNRQRDWTKPENWFGILAMTFGFPFMDNALGLFNSDTRIDKAFTGLFGAVPGDALGTAGRIKDLITKTTKGDADFEDFQKAIGKTLGPAVFLKSYPIIGPVYETMMYDGYMDSIDPMWSLEKEKAREERGFTRLIGQ